MNKEYKCPKCKDILEKIPSYNQWKCPKCSDIWVNPDLFKSKGKQWCTVTYYLGDSGS